MCCLILLGGRLCFTCEAHENRRFKMVILHPNMAHNLQKPDPAGTKVKVKMSLFCNCT